MARSVRPRSFLLLLPSLVSAIRLTIPIGTNCTDPANAVTEDGDERVAEVSECGDVLICDSGHCRACWSDRECEDVSAERKIEAHATNNLSLTREHVRSTLVSP